MNIGAVVTSTAVADTEMWRKELIQTAKCIARKSPDRPDQKRAFLSRNIFHGVPKGTMIIEAIRSLQKAIENEPVSVDAIFTSGAADDIDNTPSARKA